MTRTAILAIDPAKASGWALVLAGDAIGQSSLLASGVIQDTEGSAIASVVGVAMRSAASAGAVVRGIVEDQFLRPGARQNFKTTKSVIRKAGMWEGAMNAAGVYDVEYVEPSVWQSSVLGIRGVRMVRSELKVMSVAKARAAFGGDRKEDESDAICLGIYAATQLQLERQLRGKT